MIPDEKHPDRRHANRFPIARDLTYRALSRREGGTPGEGTTINMSSNGVLFGTSHPLHAGTRVEVAINWPAQLDGKCALNLVMRGRVARSEPGRAAIEVLQHEFRTRGKS
jgi:hypothetical protein